jgi:hypothetical protein
LKQQITGVKKMIDLMIYVCLALSVISVIMMLDIEEELKGKDLLIHVVLMISMIIVMWSIIECI